MSQQLPLNEIGALAKAVSEKYAAHGLKTKHELRAMSSGDIRKVWKVTYDLAYPYSVLSRKRWAHTYDKDLRKLHAARLRQLKRCEDVLRERGERVDGHTQIALPKVSDMWRAKVGETANHFKFGQVVVLKIYYSAGLRTMSADIETCKGEKTTVDLVSLTEPNELKEESFA